MGSTKEYQQKALTSHKSGLRQELKENLLCQNTNHQSFESQNVA